jgi:hypothetical protein
MLSGKPEHAPRSRKVQFARDVLSPFSRDVCKNFLDSSKSLKVGPRQQPLRMEERRTCPRKTICSGDSAKMLTIYLSKACHGVSRTQQAHDYKANELNPPEIPGIPVTCYEYLLSPEMNRRSPQRHIGYVKSLLQQQPAQIPKKKLF